jgi:hypothetical protein
MSGGRLAIPQEEGRPKPKYKKAVVRKIMMALPIFLRINKFSQS